jgi:hypothetical protein
MSDTTIYPTSKRFTKLSKRPVLLTVLCVLGFVWIVFAFPGILSPDLKRHGAAYPPLLGLLIALQFMAFVGVWHLKRWGVHLFIYVFLSKTILLLLIDDVSTIGTILSILFIGLFFIWYKRLDVNL